jgi:hypothetical protein
MPAPTLRSYQLETTTIPTHVTGDLIINFSVGTGATYSVVPSGWTTLATIGPGSYYYDNLRVAYRFATSSSETLGNWANSNFNCIAVVTGTDKTNPWGPSSFSIMPAASPIAVPAIASPSPDALRLTFAYAYGGGGNPWAPYLTIVPTTFTQVVASGYGTILTGGGTASATLTQYAYGKNAGTLATMQILSPSSSGFFSMF